MKDLSPSFYGLKRSALVWNSLAIFICGGAIKSSSDFVVFGQTLSSDVTLTGMGVLIWLTAAYYSVSFAFTAFIDRSALVSGQSNGLSAIEDSISTSLRVVEEQWLTLSRNAGDVINAIRQSSLLNSSIETIQDQLVVGFDQNNFNAINDRLRDKLTIDPEYRQTTGEYLSMVSGSMQEQIDRKLDEFVAQWSKARGQLDEVAAVLAGVVETARIQNEASQIALTATSQIVGRGRQAIDLRYKLLDVGPILVLSIIATAHFVGMFVKGLPTIFGLLSRLG